MATTKKKAAAKKPLPPRSLPPRKLPDGTLHARRRVARAKALELADAGWHVEGEVGGDVRVWADRETYEATR